MSLSPTPMTIRVGHSPDADDAFMFHALANGKVDTGPYVFEHELVDIETLNRRAFHGELELTAVSIHAYAYLNDVYVLCASGASMGEGYGPMFVATEAMSPEDLRGKTIAIPGRLTSAYLAARLRLGEFSAVEVPFDEIIPAVRNGEYDGTPIQAGIIIHEGQLTYAQEGLHNILDLGQWWKDETGLPLPLGANALRKDLGPLVIPDVSRLLRQSIEYALSHREEALAYALSFGRGLSEPDADQFVGMYVNERTVDFGPDGREAVALMLDRAYREGVVPKRVVPEFA